MTNSQRKIRQNKAPHKPKAQQKRKKTQEKPNHRPTQDKNSISAQTTRASSRCTPEKMSHWRLFSLGGEPAAGDRLHNTVDHSTSIDHHFLEKNVRTQVFHPSWIPCICTRIAPRQEENTVLSLNLLVSRGRNPSHGSSKGPRRANLFGGRGLRGPSFNHKQLPWNPPPPTEVLEKHRKFLFYWGSGSRGLSLWPPGPPGVTCERVRFWRTVCWSINLSRHLQTFFDWTHTPCMWSHHNHKIITLLWWMQCTSNNFSISLSSFCFTSNRKSGSVISVSRKYVSWVCKVCTSSGPRSNGKEQMKGWNPNPIFPAGSWYTFTKKKSHPCFWAQSSIQLFGSLRKIITFLCTSRMRFFIFASSLILTRGNIGSKIPFPRITKDNTFKSACVLPHFRNSEKYSYHPNRQGGIFVLQEWWHWVEYLEYSLSAPDRFNGNSRKVNH